MMIRHLKVIALAVVLIFGVMSCSDGGSSSSGRSKKSSVKLPSGGIAPEEASKQKGKGDKKGSGEQESKGPDGQQVTKGDQQEAGGDKQGADGDQQEADGDQQEANADQQEADGDQQEADTDQQEADGDQQEADGDQQEADGDQQEADGDQQEADGDQQEADGDQQEADGDQQEADGDQQEADGDQQEADGDQQEADGDQQEADGQKADMGEYIPLPLAGRAPKTKAPPITEQLPKVVKYDTSNLGKPAPTPDGKDYTCADGFTDIATVGDLAYITMDGKYCLTADIDFATATDEEKERFPLGWDINNDQVGDDADEYDAAAPANDVIFNSFTGILDGAGHKIINLKIINANKNKVGLFSQIGVDDFSRSDKYLVEHGEIKNLVIEDAQVEGMSMVGILAGYARSVKISGVRVENSKVVGRNKVGGLVGKSSRSIISNIYALNLEVRGKAELGGMIGEGRGITATDLYVFDSMVKGLRKGNKDQDKWFGSKVGGVVGDLIKHGSIFRSIYSISQEGAVNKMIIKGHDNVGGLVGFLGGVSNIKESYFYGEVEGDHSAIGGLVGHLFSSLITDSYAAGNVKGSSKVGGLVGAFRIHHSEGDTQLGIKNAYSAVEIVDNKKTKIYKDFGEVVGEFYLDIAIGTNKVTLLENVYYFQNNYITPPPQPAGGEVIPPTGEGEAKVSVSELPFPGVGIISHSVSRIIVDWFPIGDVNDVVTRKSVHYDNRGTVDNDDDFQIFKGWDTSIWDVEDGTWPLLKWANALVAVSNSN